MKNIQFAKGGIMIRNFMYLDSQKLRSISSQLFEGVAEQVLHSSRKTESKSENQKGPIASGRVLADILASENSSEELRFLEDHAYTLFEERLRELDLVNEIQGNTPTVSDKSFIKVTARLRLNDLAASHRVLKDFNAIGEAFWRVGNRDLINPAQGGKGLTDNEVRKKALQDGMQLDRKFLDSSALLIEFGFGDLLEGSMILNGMLYSAPLKREFLRDKDSILLQKYSRHTQGVFTMLGLVTQKGSFLASEDTDEPVVSPTDGIKEAMRALAYHLRTLEQTFVGPSINETVIDPIAIYSLI